MKESDVFPGPSSTSGGAWVASDLDAGLNGGPVRVQLSRAKGWRMPPNTVKVCRPTVFGNPFTIEDMGRHDAVEAFRRYVCEPLWEDPHVRADQLRLRARIPALRGKNLACWCRLDRACHGDILLELANAPLGNTASPTRAPDAELGPGTNPESDSTLPTPQGIMAGGRR